jgi:hypothetical protein
MMVSRISYQFKIIDVKYFSPACITESNTATSFRWKSVFDNKCRHLFYGDVQKENMKYDTEIL